MVKKEEIVYKKTKELKLNEKNPRKNDNAVDTVAKSIEKYGFKNPLIIDTNNVVWCGNTRLKASKKLGLEEVPCIVVTDLTEQKLKEYALLDNKTNELADWDYDMLEELLPECNLDDFPEIDFTMFGQSYIDDLMQNEFSDSKDATVGIFTISFNFPVEKKKSIDDFIKKNGKEYIVNKIIEEVDNA